MEPLGSPTISGHYTSGTLLERLRAALAADGADPERPGLEALAPYDHFHGRGLEATRELADALTIGATDHLLDIGSGIGGPARYFAERFGCRVTGIDLTAEFCAVGRRLTALLGLSERVVLEEGDALSMPFAGATFDGAYSMNVSMNIADKAAFYREILRVLRPGGWLVLSEYTRGAGPDPEYPAPWAASAEASFLASPEATRRGLEAAGFEVVSLKDTLAAALEYGARSRAMAERGEKPPHRAVQLIHGEGAKAMMANTGRALKDGGIVPIEVLARRTG